MLSLVQGFGQLDTLPSEVLHLEAMEATKTQVSSLFAIRGRGELGKAICLLPHGRLGNSL
jgi:hypothetical protein